MTSETISVTPISSDVLTEAGYSARLVVKASGYTIAEILDGDGGLIDWTGAVIMEEAIEWIGWKVPEVVSLRRMGWGTDDCLDPNGYGCLGYYN